MKQKSLQFIVLLFVVFFPLMQLSAQEPIIANHECTHLSDIPVYWINKAKTDFRIWYGHTSHGSQITSGISNLQSHIGEPYTYNSSGSGGALSYQETGGDLGHNGDLGWFYATRNKLNEPGCDRNVVIWSWCGGVSDNTVEGINIYLDSMNLLEEEYPDVKFVYMTGHQDIWSWHNLTERNQQIRDYCIDNGKILFDFADIENYNPDGMFFQYPNDNCDYYEGPGWGYLGNWADEWCADHPDSDLCWSCSCAHSKPLNCNLKGRAFWWMMAQMAGWDPSVKSFYVDKNNPNASDDNPGTEELPWATLQHAADVARPGDTLYVHEGVYNESLEIAKGGDDENGPVVFMAYPGEDVVLDGAAVKGNTGITLTASNVILEGFEVSNWEITGILVQGAADFQINQCTVHDVIYGIGITGGAHDFSLTGTEIYNFDLYGVDASPDGEDYSYNGSFYYCEAHSARDSLQNVDGFALGHGQQNTFLFEHCTAYDVFDGFDISSEKTTLQSCLAYDCWNTCYKLWEDDVELVNAIGYDGEISIVQVCWHDVANETTLRNCTFYDAGVYTVWIENSNDIVNIYNCIISGGDNIGLAFEQYSTANYHGDYNLFQNNNAARAIAVAYTDEFSIADIANGNWTAYSGQDAGSLTANTPGAIYVSPESYDLHLAGLSPAIDNGSSDWAPATDFDGNARPVGDAPDIGAYEYTGPPPQMQSWDFVHGWNNFSAYLLPETLDVETLFSGIEQQIIIVQNADGIYWPGENINTMGNWNSLSGYLIKVNDNVTLTFMGNEISDKTVNLTGGWNLIPVLSPCGLSVDSLQQQLGANLVILIEAAGTSVVWPAMNIQMFDQLEAGKGYYLFVNINDTLEFPECGE